MRPSAFSDRDGQVVGRGGEQELRGPRGEHEGKAQLNETFGSRKRKLADIKFKETVVGPGNTRGAELIQLAANESSSRVLSMTTGLDVAEGGPRALLPPYDLVTKDPRLVYPFEQLVAKEFWEADSDSVQFLLGEHTEDWFKSGDASGYPLYVREELKHYTKLWAQERPAAPRGGGRGRDKKKDDDDDGDDDDDDEDSAAGRKARRYEVARALSLLAHLLNLNRIMTSKVNRGFVPPPRVLAEQLMATLPITEILIAQFGERQEPKTTRFTPDCEKKVLLHAIVCAVHASPTGKVDVRRLAIAAGVEPVTLSKYLKFAGIKVSKNLEASFKAPLVFAPVRERGLRGMY
jgi:hypothetical protein